MMTQQPPKMKMQSKPPPIPNQTTVAALDIHCFTSQHNYIILITGCLSNVFEMHACDDITHLGALHYTQAE